MDYITYFKNSDGSYQVWDSRTTAITTVDQLPRDRNKFYLCGKAYDATTSDLVRYSAEILKASEELSRSKHISFNYLKEFIKVDGSKIHRSHTTNIEAVFKMLAKDRYEHFEKITVEEYKWFERCYNGGLTYIEPGIHQSYAYDFKDFYASLLSSKNFKIPSKAGKQMHYTKLPDTLQFGFYHVRITSNDPQVKKMFSFSPENVYYVYSLKHAIELKKTFDIQIELITDVKFNAYIYNLADMVSGHSVFNKWYKTIKNIKQEFPKNILTKMLSSSLWGHLSKRNIKYLPEVEAEKLSIGISDDSDYLILDYLPQPRSSIDSMDFYYMLLDQKEPFKYNIRLMPMITAYGRAQTGNIVAQQPENVIRVHTDGICFKTQQEFPDLPNFVPEMDKTGLIEFTAINQPCKRINC